MSEKEPAKCCLRAVSSYIYYFFPNLSTGFFGIGISQILKQLYYFIAVVSLDDDHPVFGVAAGGAFVFEDFGEFGQFVGCTEVAFNDRGFLAAFSAFEPDAKHLFVVG